MFILKNNPSLRRMWLMRRDFGTTCTQKGIAVRRSLSVRSCFGAWCTNSYTSEKTTSNGEFIRTDTRATKSLVATHYTQAQGRSMVEMLGVLAIIGVLSVGAIAGYSKAMMKYKLNKHAESFSMLLNNALQLEGKLSFTPNEVTFYGDVFKKLNLIPEGFKYVSNFRLKDMFGNEIWIYHHDNLYNGGLHFSAIGYNFLPTSQGAEICRNIAIAAKENAADLSEISVHKYYNDTDKNYDKIGTLYGDAYCIKNENCLRELDLNKIENLCNACNERACTLYVDWK